MAGKLIVVSGPSGVGKSTVMKKVMEQYDNLHFSVSATTRPIRPGEVDGKSYYFMSHEQFRTLIEQDALLEYAQYVGNFYGTPEKPLDEALSQGRDILLDIEVQGGLNVKKRRDDAILIFMVAPSFSELKRRLLNRGDTDPELCQKRLEWARWEYEQASQYDYIVVNNDVEQAANEIISILTAEKCKMKDRESYLKEEL